MGDATATSPAEDSPGAAEDRPVATQRPDPLFVLILLAVGGIAVWILLMPFVPGIARITMRRFHLESGSFEVWAAQAPVPTMYNFANEYEIQELPEGLFSPVFDAARPRYINHFPSRVLTFANGRYTLLHKGQDRWLTFRSSYRGQTLETKVHAKPLDLPVQPWNESSSDSAGSEGSAEADAASSDMTPRPWRFEWVRQSSEWGESSEDAGGNP